MAKKLFYSMGEVSEMFDVNPFDKPANSCEYTKC